MRALFVIAALAVVVAGALPGRAMMLAPKQGESITQSDLLGYLFSAPQPGDWLRYRVSIDGNTILTKIIGFGTERLGGNKAAYFEVRTQSSGLMNAPVENRPVAGGNIVWKMFVDAPNFNDGTHLYTFVAGVIKVGDSLFRLGSDSSRALSPAYRQPLQSLLLYGILPLPDERSGVVAVSRPDDVNVNGNTLHTVYTSVDFPANDLGIASGLPESRMEAWQTPDVPLGIVAIRATVNAKVYSVELTAFGRATYRSLITEQFESIPYFPGG